MKARIDAIAPNNLPYGCTVDIKHLLHYIDIMLNENMMIYEITYTGLNGKIFTYKQNPQMSQYTRLDNHDLVRENVAKFINFVEATGVL